MAMTWNLVIERSAFGCLLLVGMFPIFGCLLFWSHCIVQVQNPNTNTFRFWIVETCLVPKCLDFEPWLKIRTIWLKIQMKWLGIRTKWPFFSDFEPWPSKMFPVFRRSVFGPALYLPIYLSCIVNYLSHQLSISSSIWSYNFFQHLIMSFYSNLFSNCIKCISTMKIGWVGVNM